MRKEPPKYAQALDALRAEILSGAVSPGEKLPSETLLMQRFGYSRQTVRKALEQLAAAGWIETRQGMGSVVIWPQAAADPPRREVLLLSHYPDHYFFPLYIRSMEQTLQRSGYSLVTRFTHNQAAVETQLLSEAVHGGYAGILLFPAQSAYLRDALYLYKQLEQSRRPCVLISNPVLGTSLPVVAVDDYAGGFLAGSHLADLGHTEALCIMNEAEHAGRMRHAGFLAAWNARGLQYDASQTVWFSHESKDTLLQSQLLMQALHGKSGIFCYNDQLAFHVIRLLAHGGLRVPQDVSVIGFDDSEYALLPDGGLTTIRQDPQAIGAAAAQALLDRLAAASAGAGQLFAPELVLRGSSGAANP